MCQETSESKVVVKSMLWLQTRLFDKKKDNCRIYFGDFGPILGDNDSLDYLCVQSKNNEKYNGDQHM